MSDDQLLDMIAAQIAVDLPAPGNTERRIRAVAIAAGIDLSDYSGSDANLLQLLIERAADGVDDSCPPALIYQSVSEMPENAALGAVQWDSYTADPPHAEFIPRSAADFAEPLLCVLAAAGGFQGCNAPDLTKPTLLEVVFRVPPATDISNPSIGVPAVNMNAVLTAGGPEMSIVQVWIDERYSPNVAIVGPGGQEIIESDEAAQPITVAVCIDLPRIGVSINGRAWQWSEDLIGGDWSGAGIALSCRQNGPADAADAMTATLRTRASEFATTFPMSGFDLRGGAV